jgi:hypothetical protein
MYTHIPKLYSSYGSVNALGYPYSHLQFSMILCLGSIQQIDWRMMRVTCGNYKYNYMTKPRGLGIRIIGATVSMLYLLMNTLQYAT